MNAARAALVLSYSSVFQRETQHDYSELYSNFGMVDRPNLCTYTLSKCLQDRPVDFQDVLIAATALVNKVALVTHNTEAFEKIASLQQKVDFFER